jgi:anti-sigma factor RsiW
MDHKEAVEAMAVEKYLLDEFREEEREEFEDHFFSCYECAREVKLGVALMEHGKEIFVQEPEPMVERQPAVRPAAAPVRERVHRDRFAWLRPAFAVPVFALMLGVLAFQNLWQIPAMQHTLTAMNTAEVLPPPLYLASGGARGGEHSVTAKAGQQFVVTIDVPGDANAAYSGELYDAAGQNKLSLTIPESASKEGLSIKMPGDLPAGNYTLVVKKAATSETSEVARYAFALQRQ